MDKTLTDEQRKKLVDAALKKVKEGDKAPDTIEVEGVTYQLSVKDPTKIETVDDSKATETDADKGAFRTASAIRPQGIQRDDVKNFKFAKALQACWRRNWRDAGFEKEVLVETKALNTEDDSAGGFLVQDILSPELIPQLYANTVVRNLGATVYQMDNGEKLGITRMLSGATAYWLDQSTDKTESEPTFQMIYLDLRECIGLVPVHERLIKFAKPSIETIVRQDLMKQLALAEDLAFLQGTGGVQPLGLLSQAGVTNNTTLMGTDGRAPIWTDFTQMMYQIELNDGTYTGFAMHPRTRNTVRTLTDGNGRPLYFDGSIQGGIPGKPIFGNDVEVSSKISIAQTQGGSSDASYMILGNWPAYAIGEAGAIEIRVSEHEKFSSDQMLIRAVHYVDGIPKQPEEFYIVSGVTT